MDARTDRGQRGSSSVEYACLLVFVAALVALLLAVPFGPTVTSWLSYATCLVAGGSCPRPGATETDDDPVPEYCRRSVAATSDGLEATAVALDVGETEGYELVERSDGTFTVTHERRGRIGGSLTAGTYGRVDLGEVGVAHGGAASVATHVGALAGTTWTFDDQQDARAWIDWHRAIESRRARYDTPLLTRVANPLAWGRTESIGARLEHATARFGNGVLRRFGRGLERPVTPNRTSEFIHGEWDLDLLARAGVPGAEIAARLGGATKLGQRTDLGTGDTTVYWTLDTELAAEVSGIQVAAANAELELGGHVGVTVDAAGQPTEVEVLTTVPGDAGLDPTELEDPRMVLGDAWDGRSGPSHLYEVTLRLPVDDLDLRGVLDGLGKTSRAAATGGRVGALADRLWEQGSVGLVEHDVRSRRYGAEATTALGFGGALALGRVHTDSTAVDAHYLGEPGEGGNRGWQRWAACVAD